MLTSGKICPQKFNFSEDKKSSNPREIKAWSFSIVAYWF